MAISIGQIDIQMQETPAPPNAAAEAKPEQHVDLQAALEMLHERKLRLRAD